MILSLLNDISCCVNVNTYKKLDQKTFNGKKCATKTNIEEKKVKKSPVAFAC